MNPGLWGVLTALGWGAADFLARFTGRAVGYRSALLGMLLAGSAAMSLWLWLAGIPVRTPVGREWLLLPFVGFGTMVSTLLLYAGLARGPVSIVSPIVGSYPAFTLLLAVAAGARPTVLQWAAMVATMAGVAVVARSAESFAARGEHTAAALRVTVLISLAAAFCFGVTVFGAHLAVPSYGNLETLWVSRVLSLAAILALLAVRREKPELPARWTPVLALQGLLDTSGYVALYQAGYSDDAEIAAVTGSAFGAVTTLLAWLLLRERMSPAQWAGIAAIFAGVAVLST